MLIINISCHFSLATTESQRDCGYTSIQQPVEIYNFPPYASQEAIENRNNLYYQKYGPPAYGQPQNQEGAFQTSQKVSESSWKGGENLASFYECDPETRWSLEKAVSTASKGRRLQVGLTTARTILTDKWPDYQRSWLFHIDPFQIQGWDLLHRIVLNKENNAIQMYLFPPYKVRNLRFSDLGPNHAVAGWEVPLEHTQATTLMKNAPLADIMSVLMHDNMEGSVSVPTASFDNIVRPDWLQNTQRASISASDYRQLQKDLRDAKSNMPPPPTDNVLTGQTTTVSKNSLINLIASLMDLGNVISLAGQTTMAQAGDQLENRLINNRLPSVPDDSMSMIRGWLADSASETEMDRVDLNHSAASIRNQLHKVKDSENVKVLLSSISLNTSESHDRFIESTQQIINVNRDLGNPLSQETLNHLINLLNHAFVRGLSRSRGDNENLKMEKETMARAVANLEKIMTNQEKEIERLKESEMLAISGHRTTQGHLREASAEFNQINAQLAKENEALKRGNTDLEQYNRNLVDMNQQQNATIDDLRRINQNVTNTMNDELSRRDHQLRQNNIAIMDMEQQLSTASVIHKQYTELLEDYKAVQRTKMELLNSREQQQIDNRALIQENRRFDEQNAVLEKSNDQLKADIEELKQNNKNLNETLKKTIESTADYEVMKKRYNELLEEKIARQKPAFDRAFEYATSELPEDPQEKRSGQYKNRNRSKSQKSGTRKSVNEVRSTARADKIEQIRVKSTRSDAQSPPARSRSVARVGPMSSTTPSTSQSGNGVQPISTTSIVNPPNLAPLPAAQRAIPLY